MNQNMISETANDLKEAKQYLDSVRSEFKNDPDLLSIYEPSALELVRQFEARLTSLLTELTGTQFSTNISDHDVDIWICLEGDRFQDGQGPIDVLGSFLQRLNKTGQQVIKLLDKEEKYRRYPPLFDLARAESGSLRLGLKTISLEGIQADNDQPQLFPEDPWEKLKWISKEHDENKKRVIKAFQLLIKAFKSVENNTFKDLLVDLPDKNSLVKLLHYAKEITPSQQSPIEKISFEGKDLGLSEPVIIDKKTRKTITDRTKEITKNAEFVFASGVIRQQDLDRYHMDARPLIIDDRLYEEIRCVFNTETSREEMENFLDKYIFMSGFLIYREDNQPLHFKVEEVLKVEEISKVEDEKKRQ